MHSIRWGLAVALVLAVSTCGQTRSVPAIGAHASRPAEDRVGRAVILDEPGMPVRGAGSSPQTLAGILETAGIETRRLSATQLADPTMLDPAATDLLVLPSGESFPLVAREAVLAFLHGGGNLITTGGYAFNHLLRREDGRWQEELDRLRSRLADAVRKDRSLLANGDFEAAQALPAANAAMPGQWRRSDSDRCMIVGEEAQEGRFCARVVVSPGAGPGGPIFWQDVTPVAGRMYRASGWVRTERVIENGMAFIAVYQYGDGDKLLAFRDFAVGRGTTAWAFHTFTFQAEPGVRRLHVKFGLFQTHGSAWFDDIRLSDVTGTRLEPMNTSGGRPMDGLVVRPEQLGMFDASFPLRRVRSIRTAPGQYILREPVDLCGDYRGWAASGVVGRDYARWVPLLQTHDRLGRPRGAAAATLLHYRGHYAGSAWAYFGVDSADLFADADGPTARALRDVARFLVWETYLRNLTTEVRLVRAGEAIRASVAVENRGRRKQELTLRWELKAEDTVAAAASSEIAVRVEPGTSKVVEAAFPPMDGRTDLYRIRAILVADGDTIDELSTGVVFERPDIVRSGPVLRFTGNYFTLNGRPLFLFGTDTYAYTYHSTAENPLTWAGEHLASRDIGLDLYENLQYVPRDRVLPDKDWRAFRAMAQLTQKHGLVFMPGMLISHNVAVGDELLATQSALCGQYAEQLRETPGLLYYLNGDYRMSLDEHPAAVKALWNRWLRERYGTTERLRAAWGGAAVAGEIGELDFWPFDSGRWDDVAVVDRLRFQTWLTLRWNQAHVDAVRRRDTVHPITSEYYQIGWGGLDLIQTIDGLDVSNFGFFDRPGDDLRILPLKIRYNDLRARGKGVSLGEYGVKTHPAWTVENGAEYYHIRRTERQQVQHMLAVAHYALGLGACKIQNWCLRDAQESVFPWGFFHPNQFIPKDFAFVHRSLSVLWRHFSPRYVPPVLTVCLPNHQRLGNHESLGREVADRAFQTLLGLHYEFNVIDDHHLHELPAETRVILYPSPFAVSDDAYGRLLAWVRGGGTLLVTGDLSYDEDRRRTRPGRFRELLGVSFEHERYPNIARPVGGAGATASAPHACPPTSARTRTVSPGSGWLTAADVAAAAPCVRVAPAGAEVLAAADDGCPLLTRCASGRGSAWFFADPTEVSPSDAAAALRSEVYSAFLRATSARKLAVTPDAPWLHVMEQATARGTVHVVFNGRDGEGTATVRIATTAGEVSLDVRNGYPALAAVTGDQHIVAVNACGGASLDGATILDGVGMKAILSVDGRDVRESQALLVAPLELGSLHLPDPVRGMKAFAGEFQNGQWATLERIDLAKQGAALAIDADLATCLILLCHEPAEPTWTERISQALQHPETLDAY